MSDEMMAMTKFSSLINEIQDTTVSGLTKRQLRALTRITDLFVAGSARYSDQQIELFDEVFKVPDRGSVNPTPLGGLGQRHFAA